MSAKEENGQALFAPTHVIKARYGYWDTTKYPLGGCFHRASTDLYVIAKRDMPVATAYGYLCEFATEDGRTLWTDERSFRPVD